MTATRVTIHNRQRTVSISASSIRKLILLLVAEKQVITDSIIVYLVSTKAIAELHHQFFNDPSPTDCITFPMDGLKYSPLSSPHILGEFFICPAIAKEYAVEQGIDPYQELTLYCIHCFLHLLGYDDVDPNKRKAMRREEKKLLQLAIEKKTLVNSKNC